MILLTDVATKLQTLLNSFDSSDYLFVVKSQGYHLDSIADKNESRNTIPVFLSMVGGEYNPVPNLHEVNYTYEVNIYFPVRFKEDFYALNSNLETWFVGKKVPFGTETALCNISVAEYGEIVDLHLEQFENWVEEEFEGAVHIFKNEQDINEPYMSMRFRIYATTLGTGFLFGNDVKLSLSFDTYTLTNPTFDNASIQSNVDENGEQILNAPIKETSGAPQITSYGSGLLLYYDSSVFCEKLLEKWCEGKSQDIAITVKFTFRETTSGVTELSYTRVCYLKSVNLSITKGEPLSFTLAFAKRI